MINILEENIFSTLLAYNCFLKDLIETFNNVSGKLLFVDGELETLLNDATAVEDVLHDVFVRFASQAGSFRLNGSLKGYLAICVANRARNTNRQDRQNRHGLLNDAKLRPSEPPGPSQAAGHTEQRRILACALAQLKQEQRQVVVLHVLGSLRFREIARQTGDSINTIQSRCRYGLAKLQSLLNGEVDL